MSKTIKKNNPTSVSFEKMKHKISNFSKKKRPKKYSNESILEGDTSVKVKTIFTLVLNYVVLVYPLPFILFVIHLFVDFDFVNKFSNIAPEFLGYLMGAYIVTLAICPMLIVDLFEKNMFADRFSTSSFKYKNLYERIFWKNYLKTDKEYLYEEIIKNFTSKANDMHNLRKEFVFPNKRGDEYKFSVFFEKFKKSFTVSFYDFKGFKVEALKEEEIYLHFFETKQKDLEKVESLFKKIKEQNEKGYYKKYYSEQNFSEEEEENIILNDNKELFFDAITLKIKEMKRENNYNSSFSLFKKNFDIIIYENQSISILLGRKTVIKTIDVDNSLQISVNPNFLNLTESEENYLNALFKEILF